MLYHYTSARNAEQIYASQCFWVTNIDCFVDPSEFHHGAEVALASLDKTIELAYTQRTKFIPADRKLASPEHVRSLIKDLLDSMRTNSVCDPYVYVMSLTKNADSPHHWEFYGDKGEGTRISFDEAQLLDALQGSFATVKLLDCVYESTEKVSLVERELFSAFMTHFRNGEDLNSRVYGPFILELKNRLANLFTSFKAEKFKDEDEVRVIGTRLDSASETRDENGKTIRYVNAGLGSAVTSIDRK